MKTNLTILGSSLNGSNSSPIKFRATEFRPNSAFSGLSKLEFYGNTDYQYAQMTKLLRAWFSFAEHNEVFGANIYLFGDMNETLGTIISFDSKDHNKVGVVSMSSYDVEDLTLVPEIAICIPVEQVPHLMQFAKMWWQLDKVAGQANTHFVTTLVNDMDKIRAYCTSDLNMLSTARVFSLAPNYVDCALPKAEVDNAEMLTFSAGFAKFLKG